MKRSLTAAWIVLVVVASVGCARQAFWYAPGDLSNTTAIEGVWYGEVWELPNGYYQGVRRVTVNIFRDGSWTAASGPRECGAGRASAVGDLVVFDESRPRAGDRCLPHSAAIRGGRMWAPFETSFGGRDGTALLLLQRIGTPPPEAARASTGR
jgi:hypothetical protein